MSAIDELTLELATQVMEITGADQPMAQRKARIQCLLAEAALIQAMDKGVDFVFDLLEERLGVDVPRDAATETWDGDVSSVLGRILDAAGIGERAGLDVLAERRRQVETEGWTPEHDDKHFKGEMALAAACYVMPPRHRADAFADRLHVLKLLWPWGWDWWKPGDRRRELVKAGALIIAELARLERAAERSRSAQR